MGRESSWKDRTGSQIVEVGTEKETCLKWVNLKAWMGIYPLHPQLKEESEGAYAMSTDA